METVFSDSEMSGKIKQYWTERAEQKGASTQVTTDDVFFRELEIAKFKEKISALSPPDGATVADIGCGDGYSTLSIAAAFPTLRFVGIDCNEKMFAIAQKRCLAQTDLVNRVSFQLGDARRLSSFLGADRFDIILTMRSLINLPNTRQQYNALRQIAKHLKAGGYYFGSENFIQGQNAFNRLRVAMGLPEIPVRWHNHFFDEVEFFAETEPFFEAVTIENFASSYYLATRIIYSAGCHLKSEEPDYFHPIHQVAGKLPAIGDFCPIKFITMRRKHLPGTMTNGSV
jgi:ubiquinone/menaquinone biosynthesis C-methylase UbiE